MYGSVLIGAKYWAPGNSNTDVGAAGSGFYDAEIDSGAIRQDQLISPFQSIFTVAPRKCHIRDRIVIS